MGTPQASVDSVSGSVPLGRLVTSVDGQPEIFPVNFVVQHRSVLFRTAEGTKLAEAAREVTWTRSPQQILDDTRPPFYRWFPDAELNSCANALDRHDSSRSQRGLRAGASRR
jgi:hypothetical protein